MYFAFKSLFLPKYSKSIQPFCSGVIQSLIPSIRGYSFKHAGKSPGYKAKRSCFQEVLIFLCPPLQTVSLHSNHAQFILPRSSLFPQSLPVSISEVLPWMVFLKWRSLWSRRIQWHLGKDWREAVIHLPPQRPKLNSHPPMKDSC